MIIYGKKYIQNRWIFFLSLSFFFTLHRFTSWITNPLTSKKSLERSPDSLPEGLLVNRFGLAFGRRKLHDDVFPRKTRQPQPPDFSRGESGVKSGPAHGRIVLNWKPELSRLLKEGGNTYRRFESKGVKDQITVNVAAYVLLFPWNILSTERFPLVSRPLARLILPEYVRREWREGWIRTHLSRSCAITIALGGLGISPFCILFSDMLMEWWKSYSLLLCAALLSFVTSNFISSLFSFLPLKNIRFF